MDSNSHQNSQHSEEGRPNSQQTAVLMSGFISLSKSTEDMLVQRRAWGTIRVWNCLEAETVKAAMLRWDVWDLQARKWLQSNKNGTATLMSDNTLSKIRHLDHCMMGETLGEDSIKKNEAKRDVTLEFRVLANQHSSCTNNNGGSPWHNRQCI